MHYYFFNDTIYQPVRSPPETLAKQQDQYKRSLCLVGLFLFE